MNKIEFLSVFGHNWGAHGCTWTINTSKDPQLNSTSTSWGAHGEESRGILRSCGQMVKFGYCSPILIQVFSESWQNTTVIVSYC